MNFQSYLAEFSRILDNPTPQPPYDNAVYFDHTKLNWSRMNRWLKKGELSAMFVETVRKISQPQQWIVITEPWCGDAAHSVPFIQLAAELNPLISVDYELRDSEPFRINDYLTAGGKSVPKLIIRDSQGADLATWGPRPVGCQNLVDRLKAESADFEQQKIATQHWYNADKGQSLQAELETIFKRL